jgi:hypothetical protein
VGPERSVATPSASCARRVTTCACYRGEPAAIIEAIFTKLARWPLAPLPPRARVQPVAAAEVAARCVEVLQAEPAGRAPDFGGPEVRTLRELLELWPGRLRLLPLPIVGLALCVFANGWNTTPEHAADA